jgi:hypothetical protein
MSGREVGLAEEHEDHRAGVALADFGNLDAGMTIARADLAQILAGHAIQAVQAFGMITRGHQQFVEGIPVVSPIEVETDALAKFVFIDFTTPPFVKNMLVANEDSLHSEHHGPVSSQSPLFDQRCGVTLGGGKSVIIADQDNIRRPHRILNLLAVEKRIVAAECV